ncbi:armadillo repeat-containing protein 7-like isoform X1 [Olea europaea var. sylvestris]|uniref:armadillo repeat-containing protein 7-like isoform X1 n=2 Tax=Olea europaea var. sylvestris TaxID=158386 RepID=UPI000C1D4AF7|nr:armadillo repeat-containing protein 7-like isoform X1 [Olea europaea var. sylvestris]
MRSFVGNSTSVKFCCSEIIIALYPFPIAANMFTNERRQEERTGKYGTPRMQYLQELVSQFQNASNEESKEKIVANLANFAYDPFNYTFLRQQLNVLELFLDCITEPNERLVEFGIGGICNSCADPANAAVVTQCGGIPLVIQCLSSPVRNTVNYALGALYYLCNELNKEETLKPEVVDVIKRYAASGAISASFSNLAHAFLDKHVSELD